MSIHPRELLTDAGSYQVSILDLQSGSRRVASAAPLSAEAAAALGLPFSDPIASMEVGDTI